MRAIVLQKQGGPEELQLETLPDPVAPPGGAVVRLHAAAMNHRDAYIRVGLYPRIKLPAVLGSDGAGEVIEVADDADRAWLGRRVVIIPCQGFGPDPRAQGKDFVILGMPQQGTHAEKIAVHASRLVLLPEHLSFAEGAALPLAGLTAYRALVTRGGLQKGEHVLVTGIGGGVATLALLFARALGATVSVTSGSEAKLARAKELGAAAAVSYKSETWGKELAAQAGSAPSLIIDSAGGATVNALVAAAAPGGRIVFYGSTLGRSPDLDMARIFFKQVELRGTTMGTDDEFRAMIALVASEKLRPIVDRVFPLGEAPAAHRLMDQGEQMGKIVFDCTR